MRSISIETTSEGIRVLVVHVSGLAVEQMLKEVEKRLGYACRTGLVHPTDYSTLIIGDAEELDLGDFRWGFPGKEGQLLINARSETALDKRSFAESTRQRRCIVPAAYFHEWDKSHNKLTFREPNGDILYMAGTYNLLQNEPRFTIFTTEANESVEPYHDRMPLLIPQQNLRDWICDPKAWQKLLKEKGPRLEGTSEYEQLTLNFS